MAVNVRDQLMYADLLLVSYFVQGVPNYRLQPNRGAVAVDVDRAQWEPFAFIVRQRGKYPFVHILCPSIRGRQLVQQIPLNTCVILREKLVKPRKWNRV